MSNTLKKWLAESLNGGDYSSVKCNKKTLYLDYISYIHGAYFEHIVQVPLLVTKADPIDCLFRSFVEALKVNH